MTSDVQSTGSLTQAGAYSSIVFRTVVLAGATLVLLVFVDQRASAQGRTDALAQTGQPAPDGNGTYSTFGNPILNDNGQAAFFASLTGTSGGLLDNTGIFRGSGGNVTQIAREGQVAPDGNGTHGVFNGFYRLNDNGQVAFHGSLVGTTGGVLDDAGIFRGSGGTITQIAREGQSAPGGNGTYAVLGVSPSLNNGGQAAFFAALTGTSGGSLDDTGIFRGSGGGITQIAREGQVAADANGTYSSFGNPTLNNNGETAFRANLTGTSGGFFDDTGIFRGGGGSITQIAREGQSAPDGNGTFSSFLSTPVLNTNGEAAFRANLTGTSGGFFDDTGIFRGSGGSITQIVREGQSAPDGNGTFGSLFNPSLNAAGQSVFWASLFGTGGGSSDDTGIFRGSGASLTQIAREGQSAPDGNGTYSGFGGGPLINNNGQVAFFALLTGTSGNTTDNTGIFTTDGIDSLQVVRKGDSMGGGTVVSATLGDSLNENGQVAYIATLSNGDQALARWTPELHWRAPFSSTWDSSIRWTLGLAPDAVHDVFIDPDATVTVTGPTNDVTVRSLQVGGGVGNATLRLRYGSTVTPTSGWVTILNKGILTGDGQIAGNVSNDGGEIVASNLTVSDYLTNWNGGVIRGSGDITATTLTNSSNGEIRVGTGERLRLTTANLMDNAGRMEVIGGELEIRGGVFQNQSSTGLIIGRDATMRFNTGVLNYGSIGFSYGTSDVFGDIQNISGSTINISGGANVTFYDDLTQNGTMVVAKVGSTTSTAVLFGDFSGNGGFTGGGDVFFFGDLRPGNSPASILMDGSAYLGPATDTLIELGGLGNGEFDQFVVTGDLGIDGNLLVELINGFQLTFNDQFLFADIGGLRTGEFSGLAEGDLVGNYGGMDLFITYTAGNGNDVALFTAVPEPGTWLFCGLTATLVICRRRWRKATRGSGTAPLSTQVRGPKRGIAYRRFMIACFVSGCTTGLSCAPLQAQVLWLNTTGFPDPHYQTGFNWLGGFAPGSADTASFSQNGSYEVWWNGSTPLVTPQVRLLQVLNGDVTFENQPSSVQRLLTINGSGGSGAYSNLNISGPSADLTVRGVHLRSLGGAQVVNGASLTLDGTHPAGGQLSVQGIGMDVSGALDINAGARVSNTTGYIAHLGASNGVATVSGPGSRWDNSATLIVGRIGNGTLNVDGGGVVSSNSGSIGNGTSATGVATVSGSGSQWNSTSSLAVGVLNYGELNVEAGGVVSNSFGTIAQGTNAVGIATVTGAGSQWNNSSNLRVGIAGTATLDITAGGVVSNVTGQVATSGGSGVVNVAGPGSQWNNSSDLQLASNGAGTLNIATGGLVTVAGTTSVGALGAVNMTGGRFEFGTSTISELGSVNAVGGSLSGNLTHSGYTDVSALGALQNTAVDWSGVTVTNSGTLFGNASLGTSIVNDSTGELESLAGERMRFAGANNSNAGEINNFGGEVRFEQDMTNQSGGFISGRGTFTANGGWANQGVMAFSGATDVLGDVDNQSGGQMISSGGATTTFYDDVVHNGTEIRTSANSSTVFFGSVSGGASSYPGPGFTGTGTVYMEGDLRPGNSPGVVGFEGDLVFESSAGMFVELAGRMPGEFDQLQIDGDLSLDGSLNVNLIDQFQLGYNDQFVIADVDGLLSGGFSGLNEGDLVGNYGGMDLFITYSAGNGNDVALFTAVPEPRALVACLAGLLGLFYCRHRRSMQYRPQVIDVLRTLT